MSPSASPVCRCNQLGVGLGLLPLSLRCSKPGRWVPAVTVPRAGQTDTNVSRCGGSSRPAGGCPCLSLICSSLSCGCNNQQNLMILSFLIYLGRFAERLCPLIKKYKSQAAAIPTSEEQSVFYGLLSFSRFYSKPRGASSGGEHNSAPEGGCPGLCPCRSPNSRPVTC